MKIILFNTKTFIVFNTENIVFKKSKNTAVLYSLRLPATLTAGELYPAVSSACTESFYDTVGSQPLSDSTRSGVRRYVQREPSGGNFRQKGEKICAIPGIDLIPQIRITACKPQNSGIPLKNSHTLQRCAAFRTPLFPPENAHIFSPFTGLHISSHLFGFSKFSSLEISLYINHYKSYLTYITYISYRAEKNASEALNTGISPSTTVRKYVQQGEKICEMGEKICASGEKICAKTRLSVRRYVQNSPLRVRKYVQRGFRGEKICAITRPGFTDESSRNEIKARNTGLSSNISAILSKQMPCSGTLFQQINAHIFSPFTGLHISSHLFRARKTPYSWPATFAGRRRNSVAERTESHPKARNCGFPAASETSGVRKYVQSITAASPKPLDRGDRPPAPITVPTKKSLISVNISTLCTYLLTFLHSGTEKSNLSGVLR